MAFTSKKKESEYWVPKTLEDWESVAKIYGLKKEEPWYKRMASGAWRGTKSVLDFIQRGNYATAGFAKALGPEGEAAGENPLNEAWKGLMGKEKETFSDVLGSYGVTNKYAKAIGGFALDVVLDPTTYIGGAGLLKKAGFAGKNLTKAGRGVVEEITTKSRGLIDNLPKNMPDELFIKSAAEIEERAALEVNKALAENPDRFFKGLTFMGKEVLPRKVFTSGDVVAQKVLPSKVYRKLEAVGNTLGDALQTAFNPSKGVDRMVSSKIYGAKNLMAKVYDKQADATQKLFSKLDKTGQQEYVESFLAVKNRYWDEISKNTNKIKSLLEDSGISVSAKATPEDISSLLEKAIKEGGVSSGLETLKKIRQDALDVVNKLDIKDIAAEKGIKLSDTTYNFIEKEARPFLEDYAKRYGYEGKGLKYYIPSINQKKLKELVGKMSPATLSEKEIKLFMNKIADEDILKKPFEAYTIKERLLIRNNITRETLKDLVELQGYRKGGDFGGEIVKNISDIKEEVRDKFTPVKLIGDKNPIGFLPKDTMELVKGTLFPEMKTIDVLARASGYDAFTNMFKELVTAWFPAFHVRNAASGIIQNYEVLGSEALNPKHLVNMYRIMRGSGDDVIEYAGRKFTSKQLRELLTDRFYNASRYKTDFSQYADDILSIKPTRKINPRKLGNLIETGQKAHAFSVALDQGHGVSKALQLAEDAGFDYSVMTKFEQSVMKRLIPFYAFARKNAALQTQALISNPARIINQKKALDMFSEMLGGEKLSEEDLKGLPVWVRNILGLKVSEGRVYSGFDAPIQEFLERVSDPVGSSIISMNPIIKMPFELQAGYDFFRGKDIKDIKTINKPMFDVLNSDKTPAFIRDLFNPDSYEYEVKYGKEKGQKKTGYKANPEALYVLRNIPTARIYATLTGLFDEDRDMADRAFSFIMGGRLYDIDQELQASYDSQDIISKWQEELEQMGEGYDWNTFQVKKK